MWNELTIEQVDLAVYIATEAAKREAKLIAFEVREAAVDLLKAIGVFK